MNLRENLFIHNSVAGEPVIIDMQAEIGEDFFSSLFGDGSESITVKTIADKLKDTNPSEIILNISSPGGDLLQALAIHDYLAMQPVKKTINVNGFYASAATLFNDLGTVNMPDTSMMLIHNASAGVGGNANDMRRAADELDNWDTRIATIYQRKTNMTGKAKKMSQIFSLMEENKWISAQEAFDFGLVDKVVKGQKIAAYAETIEKINNSNILPKIDIMNFETIMSALTEIKNKLVGVPAEQVTTQAVDLTEITNRVTEIENHVAELVIENTNLTNAVAERDLTIANNATELEALKNEFSAFAKKNAHTVTFDQAGIVIDPIPAEPKKKSEKALAYEKMASK